MTSQAVVLLLVGILLGALGAWLVLRSKSRADEASAEAELATARAELERAGHEARAASDRSVADARAAMERANAEAVAARQDVAQIRLELATQRELLAQGRAELAMAHADKAEGQSAVSAARTLAAEAESKLAGALAERDAALAQVAAMEADQQRMVDQFKVLSAEQLERQGKAAEAAAAERQKQVDAIVAPLTQQLKDFQSRLGEIEKERVSISTELREQVRQVTMTGEQVRRETAALATALRKPQVRGQWGELQLKRVVEVAGMVEHCHFSQQATTTTSAETTIRPDMTVMLGDDKFVHVDSKVPLSAFLDAQEAREDAERERLMGVFTKNVRTHVDQLSGKNYWKSEAGTPEFVVMFIPAEALAAEAYNRMPDLMQYAADKGIIVATPTTLIALLKTVAFSWRHAALADNAREVFHLARELHERLGTLGGHVDNLGKALTRAVKAYNDTVGSFEGRVLTSARRLRDLNVSDLELESPKPVAESVRQLTAPELVQAEEPLALPASEDDLRRRQPSLEELIEGEAVRGSGNHLRKLG